VRVQRKRIVIFTAAQEGQGRGTSSRKSGIRDGGGFGSSSPQQLPAQTPEALKFLDAIVKIYAHKPWRRLRCIRT
jgi:hypothetical protein